MEASDLAFPHSSYLNAEEEEVKDSTSPIYSVQSIYACTFSTFLSKDRRPLHSPLIPISNVELSTSNVQLNVSCVP